MEEKQFRCSSCHNQYYDSREEQKNDWKRHRDECFPIDSSLYDNKELFLLQQAIEVNLLKEYQTLSRKPVTIDRICLLLFYGIVIKIIMRDPICGELSDDCFEEEMDLEDIYQVWYCDSDVSEDDDDYDYYAYQFARDIIMARFDITEEEEFDEEIYSPMYFS